MTILAEMLNKVCDRCGKTGEGVGWIAATFRKAELRRGRPDPGNLCGTCAGVVTGTRIADEIIKRGN